MAFLLLLTFLPIIWKLGKDLVVWTYVLGILPAMSGTFVSYTRFGSVAFPLFLAIAWLVNDLKVRWVWLVLLVLFGSVHVVLLWRFVNYRWAG